MRRCNASAPPWTSIPRTRSCTTTGPSFWRISNASTKRSKTTRPRLRTAIPRSPSESRDLAFRRKGQRLLDLGRPKEAIAAFDAALGLRPSDSETWLDAARAWQALGQTARARKMLDEAIRLDPQNVEAQRLRSEGTVAD